MVGYLRWSVMHRMLDGTVRTTAMFLLLFVGGLFSSFLLTRLGIPQGMSEFLTSFHRPPWVIIVLINLLLLVLGMFMDPTSILIIMVPILFKTVTVLGYDPVWFGVMVTILASSGPIPAFTGPNGMPVGLQIIGPVGEDGRTLALARWIAAVIRVQPNSPAPESDK